MSSMRRILGVALGLAIVLTIATGEAGAQPYYPGYGPYGWYRWGGWGPGPGSTVEGDAARGWGYYNLGTGIYNHETALATAINAQTAYLCNQYAYLSQIEAND
jgi:hypothetical protein